MTKIKAIPTKYAGHTFKSRLEARVAVFFDQLRLSWEYEPEGYDLPINGWYLPDFLLKKDDKLKYDIWIECKGKEPTIEEDNKLNELACTTGILGGFFISTETFRSNFNTLHDESVCGHDLRGFGCDLEHYFKLRYPLPYYFPFSEWYSIRKKLTPDDESFIPNWIRNRFLHENFSSGKEYFQPLTDREKKELMDKRGIEVVKYIESNLHVRRGYYLYHVPHALDHFGRYDADPTNVDLFKKAIQTSLSYDF